MINKRRGTLGAAAVAAVAGALVLGGAGAADAVERLNCDSSNYLWLHSDNTTCWGYTGWKSVTLYNVHGLSSGTHYGWIYGSGITTSFARWASGSITTRTITEIQIDGN